MNVVLYFVKSYYNSSLVLNEPRGRHLNRGIVREERSGCSRLLTLGGNILTKLVPLAWVDRHGTNLTPRPRPTQTQLNPALAIAADPTAPVGPASLWVTGPHLLRVCVGATAAAAAALPRALLRGKRERERGAERDRKKEPPSEGSGAEPQPCKPWVAKYDASINL